MSDTPVKTWRDGVSFSLGEISTKLETMHEDIKETNGTVKEHSKRIGKQGKKIAALTATVAIILTILGYLLKAAIVL